MTEEYKIRTLFRNVNYRELNQTIKALEVQYGVIEMTFIQITNHLTTKVSKFENKQAKLRGVPLKKKES